MSYLGEFASHGGVEAYSCNYNIIKFIVHTLESFFLLLYFTIIGGIKCQYFNRRDRLVASHVKRHTKNSKMWIQAKCLDMPLTTPLKMDRETNPLRHLLLNYRASAKFRAIVTCGMASQFVWAIKGFCGPGDGVVSRQTMIDRKWCIASLMTKQEVFSKQLDMKVRPIVQPQGDSGIRSRGTNQPLNSVKEGFP